jgi:hypothetical protein
VRLLVAAVICVLAAIGFFVGLKLPSDWTAAAVMMLTPLVTIAGRCLGRAVWFACAGPGEALRAVKASLRAPGRSCRTGPVGSSWRGPHEISTLTSRYCNLPDLVPTSFMTTRLISSPSKAFRCPLATVGFPS